MKSIFLDIETFPNKSLTWGMYEQNVIKILEPWYILCFGYKWIGKKTKVVAISDFKGYKPGDKDNKLLPILWDLLDEADLVIAQNGDEFDIKKINTRFIMNEIKPPSPYRTVDTLKIAKKFSFNSNHLNDLGSDLVGDEKVKHIGFPLWLGCEKGDKKSWALMKKYNRKDVDLLSEVYFKLRPWIKNHPNLDAFSETGTVCPKCGSEKLQSRGFYFNQSHKYKRFRCIDCGGWGLYLLGGQRRSYVKNG